MLSGKMNANARNRDDASKVSSSEVDKFSLLRTALMYRIANLLLLPRDH